MLEPTPEDPPLERRVLQDAINASEKAPKWSMGAENSLGTDDGGLPHNEFGDRMMDCKEWRLPRINVIGDSLGEGGQASPAFGFSATIAFSDASTQTSLLTRDASCLVAMGESGEDVEASVTAVPPDSEHPKDAARRLSGALGAAVPKVCVLGGTSFQDPETERVVRHLAQVLSARMRRDAVFVTGGRPGAQRAFAESCASSAWSFHVVPVGSSSGFSRGTDIYAGRSQEENGEALALLGDIYIAVEGGPGVAAEARSAATRGAFVVPVPRTGGASGGMFDFPTAALRQPAVASDAAWRAMCDRSAASPEEAAEAAAEVVERMLADRAGVAGHRDVERLGFNDLSMVGASTARGSCASVSTVGGVGRCRLARSSIRDPTRPSFAKKSVSFCHLPEDAEQALPNLQRAARDWLARRRSSQLSGVGDACGAGDASGASDASGTGDASGAGGASAQRRRFLAAFERALLRRRAASSAPAPAGLDEEEFSVAACEVHGRNMAAAQAAALWRGFTEGCDATCMHAAAFCDIMDAVEQGPDVACEFADIPVEEYEDLSVSLAEWAHDSRQEEAARKIQRGIRRRSSSQRATRSLGQAAFHMRLAEVHPQTSMAQRSALWRGFVEGTGKQEMREETMAALCEAIAGGPDEAAEFADMCTEDYMALGVVPEPVEAPQWDSHKDLQRVVDEMVLDEEQDGSEDFEGGLPPARDATPGDVQFF